MEWGEGCRLWRNIKKEKEITISPFEMECWILVILIISFVHNFFRTFTKTLITMYTEFHTKASDLDLSFLKGIKQIFKNKPVSIIIEEDMDDTEYLLAGEANRKMLERSLRSAEKGNLTEVNIDKYLRKKK